MKKSLIIAALIIANALSAQITLDVAYTPAGSLRLERFLTKFGLAGYKYYQVNNLTNVIEVYNTNNTLYKTINIPTYTGNLTAYGFYLSDNLFNTDTLIEYICSYSTPSNVTKLYVYNELGATVFFRDSAYLDDQASNYQVFQHGSSIFYDGSAVKMRVVISYTAGPYKYELYTLPGSIPCEGCTNGVVTGMGAMKTMAPGPEASFFPNPVNSDNLKLKYIVPAGTKQAKIKIYDVSGKLIQDYKISASNDYILLPSDYNNGLYIYSLEVDGQVVKSEKIVLNR